MNVVKCIFLGLPRRDLQKYSRVFERGAPRGVPEEELVELDTLCERSVLLKFLGVPISGVLSYNLPSEIYFFDPIIFKLSIAILIYRVITVPYTYRVLETMKSICEEHNLDTNE